MGKMAFSVKFAFIRIHVQISFPTSDSLFLAWASCECIWLTLGVYFKSRFRGFIAV
jgi:hypothetical protein